MSNMARATFMIGLMLLGTGAGLAHPARSADARGPLDGPPVTVMTQNLYLGADVAPVFAAASGGSYEAVAAAAAQAFVHASSSDMPRRAAAVAEEISAGQPHVVGLQEAAVWTSLADPEHPESQSNLALLLEALGERGQNYEAVAIAPGFEEALPTAFGYPVQLSLSDVLLARSDLASDEFDVTNPQFGTFGARIRIPVETPMGTEVVDIPRQWVSAEVNWRGATFRVISTHLESADEDVRVLQTGELLDVAETSDLPLVLVGDLNAGVADEGDSSWLLTNFGGFDDAWAAKKPRLAGSTCCHDPLLRSTGDALDSRIDFVLTRGGFHAVTVAIEGDEPMESPAEGTGVLWASDHAGLSATLLAPK